MSAPLVVNTKGGVCWTRRAVTSGGIALYAPEAVRTCPEFVMATIDELAEQGIVGSADALPMPVAPEPQDAGTRAELAELIGTAKPATDRLLQQLAQSVRDRSEHDHTTQREDWFCMNLTSFMGERMGPVLRRLLDAEARAERYRIAWGMARTRAISAGGAADRYAARSRDAQDALQHMLFTVIAGQMALHEANRERQELRARVAELEAARPAPPPPAPPAGTVRIIADVTNTADRGDARYAESRVEYALEQYGYEARVWLDTDGTGFFLPGRAYTHHPGADTIGGPRLRFYCESVTTDRTTGQPVARGWGGRRYGDRWTSVQHTRGLEDWQSGAWVDTTDSEREPAAPLTVFRASHDSIVMGLYTTAAEARKHCETEERRAWAKHSAPTNFDWIEDEEDGVAEMTAWVGGEERTTGYVVTALEVAAAYDEEADQ